MRKLKFPIRFSVVPLLLLLVLSILRMFIVIDLPGAMIVFSETLYPAVIKFSRFEIWGLPLDAVFISIWVFVAMLRTVLYLHNYITTRGRETGHFRVRRDVTYIGADCVGYAFRVTERYFWIRGVFYFRN